MIVRIRVDADGALALRDAREMAERMADDQPWNDDARELLELIRQAMRGLGCGNSRPRQT